MSRLWIDHVIYAVDDLDAAAAALAEREGLGSVRGGRHPGWGTENRIVPLGESYLELVAVVDAEEAETSDFGRAVLTAVTEERPLVGWVVATDDIETVARRLDVEVERKSRARPDGSTLSWRLAGMELAMETGAFPFFVEWDGPPEHHPGAAEVEHDADPQGIAWVEVSADEERLRDWLGDADLPLRITEGDPSITAAAIATSGGEIVLR
jgi:glyoxalase-like protein